MKFEVRKTAYGEYDVTLSYSARRKFIQILWKAYYLTCAVIIGIYCYFFISNKK